MLTVRLQRVGRRNDPSFRMVIIDSKRGVKSADYVEMVGSYNPRQKHVEVKADRVKHWLSVGAKPTDTVHNILINEKVIEGKKVNPLGKKTPIVKEKAEEETKEEAPKADAEGGDAPASDAPTEEDAPASDTPTAEETKEEDKKEEPTPEAEAKEEEAKEA